MCASEDYLFEKNLDLIQSWFSNDYQERKKGKFVTNVVSIYPKANEVSDDVRGKDLE